MTYIAISGLIHRNQKTNLRFQLVYLLLWLLLIWIRVKFQETNGIYTRNHFFLYTVDDDDDICRRM